MYVNNNRNRSVISFAGSKKYTVDRPGEYSSSLVRYRLFPILRGKEDLSLSNQ